MTTKVETPFMGLVSTNIVPFFRGPAEPPAIIAWLARCEDSFSSFVILNPTLESVLTDGAKIRFAGTALEEEDMMMWWNANRITLISLSSGWPEFVEKVKTRFITDAWKLQALMRFERLRQENREFKIFARELLLAQDILLMPNNPTAKDRAYRIDNPTIKRHLLFFANETLMRRVMDLPDFKLEEITRDKLVSLMTFQWDLMKNEGLSVSTESWEAL